MAILRILLVISFFIPSIAFATNTHFVDFGSSNTNKYLKNTSISDMDCDTGECTFQFWMYKTSANCEDRQPFAKLSNTTSHRSWRFIMDASCNMHFQVVESGTYTHLNASFSTTMAQNTWYQITATWNGSNPSGSRAHLYVNGVDDTASDATPATMNSGNTIVTVATRDGAGAGGYFQGYIDNIAYWNYELSASEVADTSDCSLVGDETGLLHYWRLDNDYVDEVNSKNWTAYFDPVFATTPLPFTSECGASTPAEPEPYKRPLYIQQGRIHINGSRIYVD